MRGRRSRRPILLVAAALAACGRSDPELPPLPDDHEVAFPDDGSPVAFRLAAEDVALLPGERERSWRLVIGEEGWAWLGHAGESEAEFRVGEAPSLTGTKRVPLPVGDVAWSGRLGLLLETFLPKQAPMVRAAPTQLQLGLAMVPQPDDERMARDLALGLGLAVLAAEWLPGLMDSEYRGVIRDLEGAPSLDAVFAMPQRRDPVDWADAWRPGRLPQGFAFLRLEAPGPALWEEMAAILERWGYDPPPMPATDFAAELHAIELQGSTGLVITVQPGWELDLAAWWEAGMGEIGGLGDLGSVLLRDLRDVGADAIEIDDELFLALGDSTFRGALRESLQRDRPPPFAERRFRWPRGSAIFLLDLRGFESALGSMAPIALPRIQGGGATERIFEMVVTADDAGIRMHASWPPGQRPAEGIGGLAQGGMRGLSSVMLQELLEGFSQPAADALDQLEPVLEEEPATEAEPPGDEEPEG